MIALGVMFVIEVLVGVLGFMYKDWVRIFAFVKLSM